MQKIAESELILNEDGSIYHLKLLPEDVADTVIFVGDPDRVSHVSRYFDRIELKKQKREFITHTGYIGQKRLSVISTGISTDNIDITLNELDALVNIDLQTRTIKSSPKSLQIVRIGTAGGLQENIPVDSFVVSKNAVGLDGLANFYNMPQNAEETALQQSFVAHFSHMPAITPAYAANGHSALISLFSQEHRAGTTVTCAGFYGPQGRALRGQPRIDGFVEKLSSFNDGKNQVTNFEMETAAIYALGNLLGHACCSLSAIVANRRTGHFSKDPASTVDKLIQYTLEKLSQTVAVKDNIA